MLKRITGPFREFGIGAGLLYALDRVLSSISPRLRLHVYELMVQPITDKPLLAPQLAARIEVREIRPGAPELDRMPVLAEVMQARLAQGCTCLGAFKKGEMIGYMWFREALYDEDEVRCTYRIEPADQSVFDFDFYLFPEHRMGRGFISLWNGANQYLMARGVRYTYSRMTRFNLASRRAHAHLGGRVVGRAVFLKLGRLEAMLSTLAPYVHVSATAAQRVSMRLAPDVLAHPP